MLSKGQDALCQLMLSFVLGRRRDPDNVPWTILKLFVTLFVICYLAYECKRGWRWPYFDTDLSAFFIKCKLVVMKQLDVHSKRSDVVIKTRSPAASLPFKGQVTDLSTVKWSITATCIEYIFKNWIRTQIPFYSNIVM